MLNPSGVNTMRRITFALLACLSAACVRTRTDPVTGRLDVDVESPLKRGEDWNARMTGQGPFAAASGTARAAVLKGTSTITVRVSGLTAGGTHAWRVYEGRCGSPGPLFGNAYGYPVITVNAQGMAEGEARFEVALDEAKKYQVRLFTSTDDAGTVAVCGNLGD
jgi:hypothetical protein